MKAEEFNALEASQSCVVCDTPGLPPPHINREQGLWTYRCTNCGTFVISDSALADLCQTWKLNQPKHMAMLSARIRRMQDGEMPGFLSAEWIQKACEDDLEFPNAFEQVENLIIWMAESLGPGETTHLCSRTCQAATGASDANSLAWVLAQAENRGWIEGTPRRTKNVPYELMEATLTLEGWELFDEIGRHKRSRIAFMAMQYGDEQLHAVVDNHFKPAITQTGFELRLLVDKPEAGIIDNRLRVEIRRSRFVIADLTHHNRGAYWEAGFGEGLGIPVIYTCRQDVLGEEGEEKVHFDTRNSLIVPWDPEKPEEAAAELKAAIRNTLPEDSRLDDPAE